MSYWDIIVNEVVKGGNGTQAFSYTNVGTYKEALKVKGEHESNKLRRKKRDKKKYFLGNHFPGEYLTGMEFITLLHVFNGKSISETAKVLALSRRTIEYYLKNIRFKMKCRYATELMTKVVETELVNMIKKYNESGGGSSSE